MNNIIVMESGTSKNNTTYNHFTTELTLFVFSRLDWNEHTREARAGNIV